MVRVCALLLVLLMPSTAFPQHQTPDPYASLQDDLLDRFVGKWDVTGTTHGTPTTQTFEVDWVLNHQFLRVYQKSSENARGGSVPFEALLMVGYDATSRNYVLYPMNIRGGRDAGVGFGRRTGNEIAFAYYSIAPPGVNSAVATIADVPRRPGVRFTWEPDAGTWHLVFGSSGATGDWQTVTELRATPAK